MYNVTIAIPVYNTQEYIRESLLSALNQTYKSIEYIIIDDRGNDNSIDIVHDLMNTHDRGKNIRIITHKKNMGLAHVRNTALKEASGKYLFFLDSDDTINKDCIEFLYNKITKKPVDFVAASYQKVNENNKILESITYPDINIEGKNKVAEYYYKNYKHPSIAISVWNKLYNLSFLRENEIDCIPERLYEDTIFTFKLVLKAQSCILISRTLYQYKIRPNSILQHNSRNVIPIKEINECFLINSYRKKGSLNYIKYPFYEFMITHIMMNCFNDISVIIDKKKIISEKISPNEIKEALAYPISFSEVCKFKHHRVLNLSLIIFSKLPYRIEILLLKIYLKLQHFYRRVR